MKKVIFMKLVIAYLEGSELLWVLMLWCFHATLQNSAQHAWAPSLNAWKFSSARNAFKQGRLVSQNCEPETLVVSRPHHAAWLWVELPGLPLPVICSANGEWTPAVKVTSVVPTLAGGQQVCSQWQPPQLGRWAVTATETGLDEEIQKAVSWFVSPRLLLSLARAALRKMGLFFRPQVSLVSQAVGFPQIFLIFLGEHHIMYSEGGCVVFLFFFFFSP